MASSAAFDYLQEAIILGIDAILFGVCLKEYYSHKNTIVALRVSIWCHCDWNVLVISYVILLIHQNVFESSQDAPQLSIDNTLSENVAAQKNRKIPYAIIRGTVTPIGQPLQSIMTPSVTGVLQVIKVK